MPGSLMVLLLTGISCCEKEIPEIKDPVSTPSRDSLNPRIEDDYSDIAEQYYSHLWGPYNLHDPTIVQHEGWYHIFSTDVAYGPNGKCGIMHRRSKDLVQWQFLGWVFEGVPAQPLLFMQQYQPGYRQESIWAPFIYSHGGQYRLYYSVPGNDWVKLACIALATSDTPEGPWTDEGIVISCQPEDHFNAIDPAVIVDPNNGKHWFTYGSYSSGIYMVELNPETGKRKDEGDCGHRIAYRLNDHDAIEGAEIIYNEELAYYYLFVSYDWLEDNYNVRVGRSDRPEGPYLDINGNDLAQPGDNYPMITAQYRFENHSGWQGVGHCGILKNESGYFFISQGRLGYNKYLMNLHVRRMGWTPDGWPVVSPERFANLPHSEFHTDSVAGEWEHIELTQTSSKNSSSRLIFTDQGTLESFTEGVWTYADDLLTLSYNDQPVYACRIFREWDWENEIPTWVYSGMNSDGKCIWGKKVMESQ